MERPALTTSAIVKVCAVIGATGAILSCLSLLQNGVFTFHGLAATLPTILLFRVAGTWGRSARIVATFALGLPIYFAYFALLPLPYLLCRRRNKPTTGVLLQVVVVVLIGTFSIAYAYWVFGQLA